jgi:type IV pilus assembly protein PilC
MPLYKFIAKTKDSKTLKQTVEADSRELLIARLRNKNLFIVSIEEIGDKGKFASFFARLSSGTGQHSGVRRSDLAFFARNLSTILSSGVTLLRSLEILSFQAESKKLEEILKQCSSHIKEGSSLSEAIMKYPNIFSPLWTGVIKVGEASGNLPFVLDKLAEYLDLRIDFERKLKSALIYPTILTVAAVIAVLIFFNFILPKFSYVFSQFDIELPALTKFVFSISTFFQKNFLIIVAALIFIVVGLTRLARHPEYKKAWDKIKLKLPLVDKLLFLIYIERFTSTMYILLDSGLPIVFSLEVASAGIGNYVLEEDLVNVKEKVKDGASLSAEFSKLNIFPLLLSEMTKIGEETGTMPQVFDKISTHYQKELTVKVERLIYAFEPTMIVIIGVMIGFIVISLFLPLFKISTLGGGTF